MKSYVERVKNTLSTFEKIRCQCQDCCNGKWYFFKVVEAHLLDQGMQETYKLAPWVYHGEDFDEPVDVGEDDDEVGNGVEIDEVVNDVENDDCHDLLHDIVENDVEDVDDVATEFPGGGANAEKFDYLFDDMKRPLYPECETFSLLTFLVKLMHVKALNK